MVLDLDRFTGAGLVHLQDIGKALDGVQGRVLYVDDGSRDATWAVMRAPPPPTPPTMRSTSGSPLRLLKVSRACHAAL